MNSSEVAHLASARYTLVLLDKQIATVYIRSCVLTLAVLSSMVEKLAFVEQSPLRVS